MLRNSKGFYLVDALVGFSIFILVISAMMPVLYKIYVERQTIVEERHVMELLHNRLQEWIVDGTKEREDESATNQAINYQLNWQQFENGIELCITWQAKNKRFYKMCGNAK